MGIRLLKFSSQVPVADGRWLAWLLACVGFVLLVSCSAVQLGYNNAEMAISWTAQEYFDLEGEQKNDFRARLADFHAWHRSEELPRYEAIFHSAGERMADGLSAEDIGWARKTLRERYHQLLGRAAIEAAPILATLTPAQLDHLQMQFAEKNRKFAKENFIGSADKQRNDRLKRMRESIAEWVGELTPGQEARIAAMVRASPSLAPYRLEERRRLQMAFVNILREHRDPQSLAGRLQELADSMESQRSPEYINAMAQYEASLNYLLLNLDGSLTPQQRKHVVEKFSRLETDLKVLAVNG